MEFPCQCLPSASTSIPLVGLHRLLARQVLMEGTAAELPGVDVLGLVGWGILNSTGSFVKLVTVV